MASERIIKAQALATDLAQETDTDFLIYNGGISRPYDRELIKLCSTTKLRKNVALFLCTYGGDASAAYRMARCLQDRYSKFTVFIAGPCKSAGTLLAVGAEEIVVNQDGELGPLDVQVGKKDEIWETDSGLTVLKAIEQLEEKAFDLFEDCFLKLKGRSGGRITLKTATHLASNFATSVVSPIIAQIDPMHVGEVSRAMNIGLKYGSRLTDVAKNAKDGTLYTLANTYPSHDFVIDGKEIAELFEHVRQPTEKEALLIDQLDYMVRQPFEDPETRIVILSKSLSELEINHEGNHEENTGAGGAQSAAAAERTEPVREQQAVAVADGGKNVTRLAPKSGEGAKG